MRVLTWNVAGRSRRALAQSEAICGLKPDILCLQEVVPTSWPAIRHALASCGLTHAVYAAELVALHGHDVTRARAVATFSRFPLIPMSAQIAAPWPELTLSVEAASPFGAVEVHNVHMPNASTHGARKTETFEATFEQLARASTGHRLLCGDLNSPKEEWADGTIVPWGGTRQATAELQVLSGLERYGWVDVYRTLHRGAVKDSSWWWKSKGRAVARRFDHVFISASLRPISCSYLHQYREAGLSDHSPLIVELDPGAADE